MVCICSLYGIATPVRLELGWGYHNLSYYTSMIVHVSGCIFGPPF